MNMTSSNDPQTVEELWLSPTFRQGLDQLGLVLSDEQVHQFGIYQRELESWNRLFNLTRIVGHEPVQVLHFLDSLTAVLALSPETRAGGKVIDVATGAGFPGIPLKIALPGLRLTLVDSIGKKATFLEHLLDALNLPDVELLLERAESLAHEPDNRDAFDVVLARGLAPLRVLAELTLPFCKTGRHSGGPQEGRHRPGVGGCPERHRVVGRATRVCEARPGGGSGGRPRAGDSGEDRSHPSPLPTTPGPAQEAPPVMN